MNKLFKNKVAYNNVFFCLESKETRAYYKIIQDLNGQTVN